MPQRTLRKVFPPAGASLCLPFTIKLVWVLRARYARPVGLV